MLKQKSIALILGVLTMSLLISYIVLAWTNPTATPPGENVSSPVNIGSVQQWKKGGLGIGEKTFDLGPGQIAASVFYDKDNSSWYVNPSGISVFSGNVGIGTTSPGEKLDIQGGSVKINTFKLSPISATELGIYDSGGNQIIIFDEGL